MTDLAPTELGRLLEAARRSTDGTGISGREAARRAGISGTRWRQLVNDEVGPRVPPVTVIAAALAVQADPATAHRAAFGTDVDAEQLATLIEAAQNPEKRRPTLQADLAQQIERISRLPLPAAERLRVASGVIALFEEMVREQDEETIDSDVS